MATDIINNGATIKITTGTTSRFIVKSKIMSLDIVKTNIIKLDTGQGINNVYITYADVTTPVTANVEALRDAINTMLGTGGGSAGGSTEQKQDNEIQQLTLIKTDLDNLLLKITTINDKAFYDPLLVDEGTPNTIYKGYASPGTAVTDALWAIAKTTTTGDITTTKWAGGNKDMTKIWNNREALVYA